MKGTQSTALGSQVWPVDYSLRNSCNWWDDWNGKLNTAYFCYFCRTGTICTKTYTNNFNAATNLTRSFIDYG